VLDVTKTLFDMICTFEKMYLDSCSASPQCRRSQQKCWCFGSKVQREGGGKILFELDRIEDRWAATAR